MKKQFTPWDLGATLYMPATRMDLAEVVLEGKIPGLRSLVVWKMRSVNMMFPLHFRISHCFCKG